MKITIRRMTLDDIEQVVAIDQASFTLPWTERSFRYELTDNPASRCWVAEKDGRVVGMIVAWLLVDEAHIATIATHAEFRRRGIAKQLLTHTLQGMLAEGAQSSFLEVRENNVTAREMYRKFGFEESGRRHGYYKDNGEDAILMTLEGSKVQSSRSEG
jgi:ribosomal-protein-alanine N-acetyltransferase